MTTPKHFHPASSPIAKHGLMVAAVALSLSGCGMINSVTGTDKVDYKSVKKASTLEVPPDLTQLQKDNRYALPEANNGVVTASGYNAQKGSAPAAGTVAVVPDALGANVRVERAGDQRWLVVKQSPEALWPQLKAFWEDAGFTIALDTPAAGIMETEWNENRAKIPQDILRRTVGKVFDSLYSTGERDKFRTRLERQADGATEIYVSHRGMEEVVTGQQKEGTIWTSRANDPALEAQFLARLMSRLSGGDEAQAKSALAGAPAQEPHAKLAGAPEARYVALDESFDRAWRRVGLALDRVGFTVEDRDRAQGVYFVRYVDPDAAKKSEGFFGKLFSSSSSDEKDKDAQRYRIAVKGGAGATSELTVLNNQGQRDSSSTSAKILALLTDQLK